MDPITTIASRKYRQRLSGKVAFAVFTFPASLLMLPDEDGSPGRPDFAMPAERAGEGGLRLLS